MNRETELKRLKYYRMISAILGWIGAVGLLFLAFYIFLVYQTFSTVPPMGELTIQVYSLSTLTIGSAVMLIYGSFAITKLKSWKGGIINLLAGTVVPIPTYVYFTFYSQPKLLVSWLIPVGFCVLIPSLVSAAICVLLCGSQS